MTKIAKVNYLYVLGIPAVCIAAIVIGILLDIMVMTLVGLIVLMNTVLCRGFTCFAFKYATKIIRIMVTTPISDFF